MPMQGPPGQLAPQPLSLAQAASHTALDPVAVLAGAGEGAGAGADVGAGAATGDGLGLLLPVGVGAGLGAGSAVVDSALAVGGGVVVAWGAAVEGAALPSERLDE